MNVKGDTERQATLRNEMIKRKKRAKRSNYVLKISSVIKAQMKILDVGCGTAHIIEELSGHHNSAVFVGLDVSPSMLKVAKLNTARSPNIILVDGDGLKLPFTDHSFDVVITRLAEYSPQEAYRVLKNGGFFFEYGLGPEANKEIVEFFQRRIEKDNFLFPKNLKKWKKEVCEEIANAGFLVDSIDEYKEKEYYRNIVGLMNLIEMVPLVKDFDSRRDRKTVDMLAKKYWSKKGIQITWRCYILMARRS